MSVVCNYMGCVRDQDSPHSRFDCVAVLSLYCCERSSTQHCVLPRFDLAGCEMEQLHTRTSQYRSKAICLMTESDNVQLPICHMTVNIGQLRYSLVYTGRVQSPDHSPYIAKCVFTRNRMF